MYENAKVRLELEAAKISIRLLELKQQEILEEKKHLRDRFVTLQTENRRLTVELASFRTPKKEFPDSEKKDFSDASTRANPE
jgi:hypothetical protein